MDMGNWTAVSDLILLGFTKEMNTPLFVLFSIVYLITIFGNIGMAVIIWNSPQLHVSMYFFLCSLSLVDACIAMTISPKMLVNFLMKTLRISILGCATQMYVAVAFGTTECFILVIMAYDRYVAICSPLHYSIIMTKLHCLQLISISYITGFLHSLIHTIAAFMLPMCKPAIHHFFCDIQPVLKLSCKETVTNEILLFVFIGSITTCCLLITLLSYICILGTVLKINSTGGRYQTFSTCASHLLSVLMFFCSVIFMYLRPNSSYQDTDLSASVFYSIVIPMLNPFIYTVRNREVKMVIRKTLTVKVFCNSLG